MASVIAAHTFLGALAGTLLAAPLAAEVGLIPALGGPLSLADRDSLGVSLRGLCAARSSGQQAPGRRASAASHSFLLPTVAPAGAASLLRTGGRPVISRRRFITGFVTGLTPLAATASAQEYKAQQTFSGSCQAMCF